jgi:plasmid stabilization system protein ParE
LVRSREERFASNFIAEFNESVERLLEYPRAWPVIGDRVRRIQLRRFPYAIFYQIRDDDIFIVAIAHMHRQPRYWVDRIADN